MAVWLTPATSSLALKLFKLAPLHHHHHHSHPTTLLAPHKPPTMSDSEAIKNALKQQVLQEANVANARVLIEVSPCYLPTGQSILLEDTR